MISDIAQNNLRQDKKVLGKKWLKTYNNYFSDEKNINRFVRVIKPFLPPGELEILYAASASGLLGEQLVGKIGRGRLTLVDISRKHLAANKNPKTKKVCCDLLYLNLKKKFDLIIMRSSLDYFPDADLQIAVLKIIKKHLKPGGFFINQPAYIGSKKERDIMSQIYNRTPKIGNRYFQSSDLKALYKKAGFNVFKKIGAGKELCLTHKEHIERYGVSTQDIKNIQLLIERKRKYMRNTKAGYQLEFDFPIFLAK